VTNSFSIFSVKFIYKNCEEMSAHENPVDSNDDDVPQLSAETFSALSQFYQEQEELDKELASIQMMAAQGSGVAQVQKIVQNDFNLTLNTHSKNLL
jgi:hypothetical protein